MPRQSKVDTAGMNREEAKAARLARQKIKKQEYYQLKKLKAGKTDTRPWGVLSKLPRDEYLAYRSEYQRNQRQQKKNAMQAQEVASTEPKQPKAQKDPRQRMSAEERKKSQRECSKRRYHRKKALAAPKIPLMQDILKQAKAKVNKPKVQPVAKEKPPEKLYKTVNQDLSTKVKILIPELRMEVYVSPGADRQAVIDKYLKR